MAAYPRFAKLGARYPVFSEGACQVTARRPDSSTLALAPSPTSRLPRPLRRGSLSQVAPHPCPTTERVAQTFGSPLLLTRTACVVVFAGGMPADSLDDVMRRLNNGALPSSEATFVQFFCQIFGDHTTYNMWNPWTTGRVSSISADNSRLRVYDSQKRALHIGMLYVCVLRLV